MSVKPLKNTPIVDDATISPAHQSTANITEIEKVEHFPIQCFAFVREVAKSTHDAIYKPRKVRERQEATRRKARFLFD